MISCSERRIGTSRSSASKITAAELLPNSTGALSMLL
ncbi:Uncharacterised protein [Mycobacteroides abscessus subsp. abscessus]|nr:Uncharacterised protein [Mycobacteroides abscessus subsp. abscessus]